MENFIKLTKDKKVLIDVGCSYGAMSLCFTTDETKTSYAIDGSIEALKVLEETLKLNPNKKVIISKVVFGDADAVVHCAFDTHQIFVVNGMTNTTEQMQKLDTFCEKNKIQPDVIKIDTEGCEYKILLGSKNVIEKYHPMLFVEIHPNFLKHFYNNTVHDVIELYKEFKYQAYDHKTNKIEDYEKYLLEEKTDSNRTVWIYEKQ